MDSRQMGPLAQFVKQISFLSPAGRYLSAAAARIEDAGQFRIAAFHRDAGRRASWIIGPVWCYAGLRFSD